MYFNMATIFKGSDFLQGDDKQQFHTCLQQLIIDAKRFNPLILILVPEIYFHKMFIEMKGQTRTDPPLLLHPVATVKHFCTPFC